MKTQHALPARLSLWLALFCSSTGVLSQDTITETSFVTVNDVTTQFGCASSDLPICDSVTWDPIFTSESTSAATSDDDGSVAPTTVIETETLDPETITAIDVSTATDSFIATVTAVTTFTTTPPEPIPSGEPFTLSITDADGNPLNLIVLPDGTVAFVDAATNPDSEPVFIDENGVMRFVSDQTEIIFLLPSTVPRARLQKRQTPGVQLRAGDEDNLPPGAIISGLTVSGGVLTYTDPDGNVVPLYISATGEVWAFSDGPPAGFTLATIGATPNDAVISSSTSMTSSSSSSTGIALESIITTYLDFCSTLLGQIPASAATVIPAATGTTLIGDVFTNTSSTIEVTRNVTSVSTSTPTSVSTSFRPNVSPPPGQRHMLERRQASTPSALTGFSGASLTSACQGAIGTTYVPTTSTTTVLSGTVLSTGTTVTGTIAGVTDVFNTTVNTITRTTRGPVSTVSHVAVAGATLRASIGGTTMYLVPGDTLNADGYSYPLVFAAAAGTTVWSIDQYGRLSTTVGGTAFFISDQTTSPGAGPARLMSLAGFTTSNSGGANVPGYWLGFFRLADNSLIIDPHRNNGEANIIECTYNSVPNVLGFSAALTSTGGTSCAAVVITVVTT
ncbi:hypothetical protein DRE_04155 [Drechslerella stenobrocha 248]|uniref:Uncharacterized protein n=1 Tax=Drechslerella stenobrocha 248 TaxID=1043628 RepID=W7I3A7_9PEZI|nr:hypothetical protein DRE_04155 [Drechslerella stenobrocha 248]